MFTCSNGTVNIEINLDNGIHTLSSDSATGKTRLFNLLREQETYRNQPIGTYTYEDKLRGIPIESVLISGKHKLIMLDRYDMYEGDGASLIRKCAKTSIVLIVCKGRFTVSDEDEWCDIEMTADHIEVSN